MHPPSRRPTRISLQQSKQSKFTIYEDPDQPAEAPKRELSPGVLQPLSKATGYKRTRAQELEMITYEIHTVKDMLKKLVILRDQAVQRALNEIGVLIEQSGEEQPPAWSDINALRRRVVKLVARVGRVERSGRYGVQHLDNMTLRFAITRAAPNTTACSSKSTPDLERVASEICSIFARYRQRLMNGDILFVFRDAKTAHNLIPDVGATLHCIDTATSHRIDTQILIDDFKVVFGIEVSIAIELKSIAAWVELANLHAELEFVAPDGDTLDLKRRITSFTRYLARVAPSERQAAISGKCVHMVVRH
ncbi:hypothetical protein LTS10_002332 [Elasticomyces elasticus]|nr:hypothetical protein LTS10_002332 [Elasticomyces elasticus]